MKTLRLNISTAIDMANYINEVAGKHTSDEIPYVELTSGDPLGSPGGCDHVTLSFPLCTIIGDD